MTIETKEETNAHKELHNKIYDCGCCPLSEKEEYCDDCKKAVIDFMNKYGAGVLTRDELIESLKKILGEKISQLAKLDENTRKQIRKLKQECHQWKETCEILADPNIKKSITKSLKQFAEGKGIKLKDL